MYADFRGHVMEYVCTKFGVDSLRRSHTCDFVARLCRAVTRWVFVA